MNSSLKLRRSNSLNINDARIAGLYDLEHTIGKGHFAVVKLAKHVFTGEMVAVKVIDKTKLDPISTAHMMQEVRCMKLVQHPNIVRLYEIIDTQTKLFLILELGDFDMYEYIMRKGYDKGGCKESDAQVYFNQIVKAINYCHKLHVVHRDLKPENVVFFESLGMVKLTDFGFSNLFTPGQQLRTSCGSLAYSAPEILLGDAYDAPAVDIWSLGVILYMLVCGRLPFQESNESETLTRILDCNFKLPDHISAGCRQLIYRMLVRDPVKRANLNEIVESPWVIAGERGHAELLPLIMRDHLPMCAHTTIVEQMVAGQIGTEEEILRAIESDEYNYMTATYYLLAERVLSSYRQEQARRLLNKQLSSQDESGIDEKESSSDSSFIANGLVNSAAGGSTSGGRSRSRSNSWRGPAPRRPCSVLKEESEEELSTYLRNSSRQSSRFYNPSRPSLMASRASSNDSFIPGPGSAAAAILEDDVEQESDDAFPPSFSSDYEVSESGPQQRLLAPIQELRDSTSPAAEGDSDSSYRFNALDGYVGGGGASSARSSRHFRTPFSNSQHYTSLHTGGKTTTRGVQPRALRNAASLELFPGGNALSHNTRDTGDPFALDGSSATSPPTPCSWTTSGQYLERHQPFTNLSALRSLSTLSTIAKMRNYHSLSRRNSSPSVSMLAGLTSSLPSSRDRISPQAIQEMLEFSRLSGRMRRAASPDSRFSSRSPSPSCCSTASGRTSPAVTAGLVSRFKGSSLLPTTSGGMRKLSSSPHLLGICEESEEFAECQPLFFDHPNRLASQDDPDQPPPTMIMTSATRNNRSSSTGFPSTSDPINFGGRTDGDASLKTTTAEGQINN